MPDNNHAAFISYCRDDQEFALRLAQDLKSAGAAVWLDQLDIKPGSSWDNAVEDALLAANQMLVILTPTSVRSENVRDEISYALKQGKIVIPVLYMECVIPLRLERKQHIDFRADYARGLKSLLGELRVDKPDETVLEKAAEGDAQRQLAWQARDADAERRRRDEEQARKEQCAGSGIQENSAEVRAAGLFSQANPLLPLKLPQGNGRGLWDLMPWMVGAIFAVAIIVATTLVIKSRLSHSDEVSQPTLPATQPIVPAITPQPTLSVVPDSAKPNDASSRTSGREPRQEKAERTVSPSTVSAAE